MYSNFEQYRNGGGQLKVDQYNRLAKRAGYLIDYYTMGRARDAPASMAQALADCECALIDQMAQGRFAFDGITSFSNDGYSETRAADAESRAALRSLLASYLTVPENLLGLAGRACV